MICIDYIIDTDYYKDYFSIIDPKKCQKHRKAHV